MILNSWRVKKKKKDKTWKEKGDNIFGLAPAVEAGQACF